MVPVVRGLKEKYSDRIRFVSLDMDDPDTYRFQDVLGVVYRPEFYLLSPDGKTLKKYIGFTAGDVFEAEFINQLK